MVVSEDLLEGESCDMPEVGATSDTYSYLQWLYHATLRFSPATLWKRHHLEAETVVMCMGGLILAVTSPVVFIHLIL